VREIGISPANPLVWAAHHDFFVHDRLTGSTERVSVDSAAIQGYDGNIQEFAVVPQPSPPSAEAQSAWRTD
jgi:hypothetical protein